MIGIGTLILLFLIVMFITPVAQLLYWVVRRALLRRRISRSRRVRMIEVVHRMETAAVYGIPIVHWIAMPLMRETLHEMSLIPAREPLDVLVHVPDGIALRADAIAEALAARSGEVTLVVPQYALSGSLLLALAADRVLMSADATLGAFDTEAEESAAVEVLRRRCPADEAENVMARIRRRELHRDQSLSADDLRELGIAVSTRLPDDLQRYLTLFRQPPLERAWPLLLRLPNTVRRS